MSPSRRPHCTHTQGETPHRLAILLGTLLAVSSAVVAQPSGPIAEPMVYKTPSVAVTELLTAPPPPTPLVHARSGQVALQFKEAVIELQRLTRPYLGLAGFRFDPLSRTSGVQPLITRVEVIDARNPQRGETIVWEPRSGALLRYLQFSPDGHHLSAIKLQKEGPAQLVLFDIRQGTERQLDAAINAAWGDPCAWIDAQSLMCRLRPADQGALPARSWGPLVLEHRGGKAPTRTYNNLLENDYEDSLFDFYFTAELGRVGIDGSVRRVPETGGLISAFDPAPGGDLAIITRVQRPYSRLVPASRFPSTVEVWRLTTGERRYTSQPSGYGFEPENSDEDPRRIAWKPGPKLGVGFVESVTDESGTKRYRWMTAEAPFSGEFQEVVSSEKPIARFGWTIAGTPYFTQTSDGGARIHVFVVYPDGPREIWQAAVADRYNDPGYAIREDGLLGPVLEYEGRIFLAGDGLGPEGPRPFLEALHLETEARETLFTAEVGVFETVLAILDPVGPVLITSRETETTPPNLYRVEGKQRTALRPLDNPYAGLERTQRRMVSYTRKDGVPLNATLYTPGDWDGVTRLPTLIWIYPYEFSDREHAGQLDVRAFRFHTVKGPSPLSAVLEGYAVLVNPTVPIVHEGAEMNDGYLEQLVDSGEAAVDHLVAIGVTDPDRVAVGGRSYGAFSSANLLMHSQRFATAIAMSGAYNRTLTPFGFQHEKRSFWEATELYTSISPFFHADQIKRPILLVHGGADPNPGTPPLQARRFFHALVGEGVHVRFVELPFEEHHYWARESVLDAAHELIEWLDRTIGPEADDPTIDPRAGDPASDDG